MIEHEKLLSNLIETQSLSGQEGELRGFIQNWFKERKVDSFAQGDNLLVHLEGRDPTRAFVFNSHMDTVGPGDDKWKYGPWTPTKDGDKFYGLGASDMKSGLAATMLLAEKISKSGIPPVDVWFTYVTKEEVDGSGTEKFADWFFSSGQAGKYKEIAGIFTEPTSLTEVEYGHRGNYFLEVTAEGPSGHASRPWKFIRPLFPPGQSKY
jgi:acetylornithine deacetylase/succinyl-diaminopimelate desuccinylase-like protein